MCISSSVHSIEITRSYRFIGGQLSERTMTCVRLSASLVTLNFDYVSCVLRPRLVANVNSSVSSCVEHWKSNDSASVVSYCFCKHAAA